MNKSTALHFAVLSGLIKNVQALIKHGCKVNSRDSDGNTPLHIAVQTLVEYLRVPEDETEEEEQERWTNYNNMKAVIKELLFSGSRRSAKNK